VEATDGARRWASTESTRDQILDAALDVFVECGFEDATMKRICARAGKSTGSVYHHFEGKEAIFIAIFLRIAMDCERRINAAANAGGTDDETYDLARMIDTHTRAYLAGIWAHRRAARMIASAVPGPPGFQPVRKAAMANRFRRWTTALRLGESARDQLLASIVVATMGEAALAIAECDDEPAAQECIEASSWLMQRLVCR